MIVGSNRFRPRPDMNRLSSEIPHPKPCFSANKLTLQLLLFGAKPAEIA